LGYAVTLGDSSYVASFSRAIGNYNSNNVATSVLWMRMLYKPGAQVTGSAYTARPFELYTINFANILSLERTVGLVPEAGEDELAGIFSLNLLGATVASTNFDLAASSTSLLLFKLTVDQGTYQAEVTITNEDASTYLTNVTLGNKETLKMWVNPTASTEGGLGDPVAYATADVLQPDPFTGEANDSIAYFNSVGYGDTVDEIVFGTTLADALAPSTDPARLQPLIADDAFNYTPLGSSLDMGDGGSVGNNWLGPWSADVRAVAGPGLTYATYALGQGNGATLGDADNPGLISRELADYGAADVVWLRVLYSPGGQAALSPNTAVPFNLFSINAGNSLVLERTVSAGGGAGDEIYALSLLGSTNDTVYFDLTNATTYLLLCKLTVDQATDQNETLQMWINPTATSEAGLGTADVTLHADILGGGDDYLALFSALGYGDAIDELALGRTFAAATTPGTDPLTRLQAIWTGGSLVDAHWSTPENWLLNSPPAAGDHVLFPVGAARLANTNDLVTSVGLLTFGVGGYQIFGNPLTNNGGIANNILAGTTVWNTNLTLGAAQSFTTAQGGLLSLNGALANGGFLLTVDGEGDTQFNGVGGEVEITDVTVTGTGGLTKAGGGTLTLATATTYSGATTVDGGTLVVKGSTAAASAVTVAAGATLSGSNIVGGTVLLNGAIAPGVNVGSLATGAETWAAGASYDWQINQIAGTAGGTSGWDLLNITGGLAITATSNQPVTLNVSTLDPTTGASGQAGGTLVPTGTYAWKIAAVTTAITGFDLAKFNVVSTGFLNDTGAYGAFALETRTTAKELWLLYGQRPQITTDPVDLQVQCDGTPSFTVVAAGSGTLHYQWYFNTTQPVGTGTPVGTDAATWSTNSAVGNAGYYQCVVSSSYGSASSAEAQLQVVDSVAPVIGTLTASQTQPYVGVVTVKDSVAPTLQRNFQLI
jgi:autotransporter-associated beta strand protein